MRHLTIPVAALLLSACATTSQPADQQSAAADRSTTDLNTGPEPTETRQAVWDGETMIGGFRFVDGLPPEGQYNAVADESGTILRGYMVDSQGRVCRRMRVTGSNIPEIRCRTPEQWEAIREAGQERIRHRQATGYMFRGG